MLIPRLIPSLLVDSNLHLVKTKSFADRNYIGDPLNSAYIFSRFEADELIVLDIDASPMNRTISLEFVEALACFTKVPLCIGGGIMNLEQIRKLLSLGVEKVAISSSLSRNFEFLEKATNRFGSSSISVIINCFKGKDGFYKGSFGIPKRQKVERIEDVAFKCQESGAGELIINNIDLEGTRKGYDISLIKSLNEKLTIPLIALGGCGELKHIEGLLRITPVSGISCGSFLVYAQDTEQVLLSYKDKKQWLEENYKNF